MKPRFSILSLMIVVALVAFAIFVANQQSHIWRYQRELTTLNRKIESLESSVSAQKRDLEDEFSGVHRNPILLIDPRVPNARPWIFEVKNSKYRGGGGHYRVGSVDQQQRPKRSVQFELRLLRSLDKTDYYRLLSTSDGNPQPEMVFQYSGKSKVLLAEDTLTVTIAPDHKSALEAALGVYEDEQAERLRADWTSEPYQATTRPMNSYDMRRSIKN